MVSITPTDYYSEVVVAHSCAFQIYSLWLPGYIEVTQTILVILTMVGVFLDIPHTWDKALFITTTIGPNFVEPQWHFWCFKSSHLMMNAQPLPQNLVWISRLITSHMCTHQGSLERFITRK